MTANKECGIGEALVKGSESLRQVCIENANLDASVLLSHVLGLNRSMLITHSAETISADNFNAYNALIDRRAKGECCAYITGKKEFWGLDFQVNSSVLVPRPETEILVEKALIMIKQSDDSSFNVLDLCTGSGAIAIALKHEMPNLTIHASDISADALAAARVNAALLLPASSTIHFHLGDLYNALPQIDNNSFNLIVSNPPYIPTQLIPSLAPEVQGEPRLALDGGTDGLDIIRRIIQAAHLYLKRGGAFLIEADPSQVFEISDLMKSNSFNEIELYMDYGGYNRVIGAIYE